MQVVVTLDVVPVLLPDGGKFGELRMRHNPNCRTSWGLVVGPISPDRKINIVARRPADGTVSPDRDRPATVRSFEPDPCRSRKVRCRFA